MPAPCASLDIRPERPDHPQAQALLSELDAYLASLYPPEANHILDVQALMAPGIRFFAAYDEGRIVGCAAVRRMPGEEATGGEAYGEIKRMMVSPGRRGQGLGRRLLHTLEQALREQGVALALLETGRDQHEAVRLYRRCGYAERGAFGGYPDNGLSLFMARRLEPA